MDTSDLALLEQWVAHRDAEAFAELVRRHVSMVYATCRRVLGSEAGAEDVAQECFAEVVQLASASRVEVSLGGWLHTLATRTALKRLRSDSRRRKREQEYAAQSPLHTEAELDDVQPYLDEAIAALPAKLRVPLVVHFLEGKTHQEVADMLGLPRTTVTSRVAKGVHEVRSHLTRRGVVIGASALTLALIGESAQAVPPALTATLGKMALLGTSATPAIQITSHMFTLANIGGKLMSAKTVIVLTILAFVAGSYVVSQATTQVSELNANEGIIESSAADSAAAAKDVISLPVSTGIAGPTDGKDGTVSEEQSTSDEVTPEMVREAIEHLEFERASLLLEKAPTGSGPEQPDFHLYRGILYRYENRPQHAISELQACEALLAPDNTERQKELFEEMGKVYRDLGDFQKAADYIAKKALLDDETDYQSHVEFIRQLKPIEVESQLPKTELDITDFKGLSTVTGSINGREIKFVVATGSTDCAISPELVEELGLKVFPDPQGCEKTIVDSFALGDCTVRNAPFIVADNLTLKIFSIFTIMKIDAVLGMPVLKQFDITIANKSNKFILEVPAKREEPATYGGNFYLFQDRMLLPVGVNSIVRLKLMMNTGNSCSCNFSTDGIEFLAEKGVKITRNTGGEYFWGTGHRGFGTLRVLQRQVEDMTLNLPGCDAGPYTFREDSDRCVYGALGNEFLKDFNIHIDFQNMKVEFQKLDSPEKEES